MKIWMQFKNTVFPRYEYVIYDRRKGDRGAVDAARVVGWEMSILEHAIHTL